MHSVVQESVSLLEAHTGAAKREVTARRSVSVSSEAETATRASLRTGRQRAKGLLLGLKGTDSYLVFMDLTKTLGCKEGQRD